MESEEMSSGFPKMSMPTFDQSPGVISSDIVILGSSFSTFSAASKFLDEGFSVVLLYPVNSALGLGPSPKVQLFPLFSADAPKADSNKSSRKFIFDCDHYKLATEWIKDIFLSENLKSSLEVMDGFIFPFDDSETAYKDFQEEHSLLHFAGYNATRHSGACENENISPKLKYSNVLQLNPAEYLNRVASLVMKKGGRIISCEADVSVQNHVVTTDKFSITFDSLLVSRDSLELERTKEILPPPLSLSSSSSLSNPAPPFQMTSHDLSSPKEHYCVMVFEIKKNSLKTSHFYKDCRSSPYYIWTESGKEKDFLFIKGEKHTSSVIGQEGLKACHSRMERFVRAKFSVVEENIFNFITDVANFDNFYDLEVYLKQFPASEGKEYLIKPISNFTENLLHATYSGLKFVETFVKKLKNEQNFSIQTGEMGPAATMMKNGLQEFQMAACDTIEETKSKELNIIDSDVEDSPTHRPFLKSPTRVQSAEKRSSRNQISSFSNPLTFHYPNAGASQLLGFSRSQTSLSLNSTQSKAETNMSPKAARTSFPWERKNLKKSKKMEIPNSSSLFQKTNFKPFPFSASSPSPEFSKSSSPSLPSETKSEVISTTTKVASSGGEVTKSMDDSNTSAFKPSPHHSFLPHTVPFSFSSSSSSSVPCHPFPSQNLFPAGFGSSSPSLSSFSYFHSTPFPFSSFLGSPFPAVSFPSSNGSSKLPTRFSPPSNADNLGFSSLVKPSSSFPSSHSLEVNATSAFSSAPMICSLFPSNSSRPSLGVSPIRSPASSQSISLSVMSHGNFSNGDADVSKDFLSLSIQSSPPQSKKIEVDISSDLKNNITVLDPKSSKCELLSWDMNRVEIKPGYDDCIFDHDLKEARADSKKSEETEQGNEWQEDSEEDKEKNDADHSLFDYHQNSDSEKSSLNPREKTVTILPKQKRMKSTNYEKIRSRFEKMEKQMNGKMDVQRSPTHSELGDKEAKRSRVDLKARKAGRKPKHFGEEEWPVHKEDVDKNKMSCVKTCANCGTSRTPLWRNGPSGPKSLCNACGIRYNKSKNGKTKSSVQSEHKSSPGEAVKRKHYEVLPSQASLGKSPSNKSMEKGILLKRKTGYASHNHDSSSPKSENHFLSDWDNPSPGYKKKRTKRLAVEYDSTTSEEKLENESSGFTQSPSLHEHPSMDSKKGKAKMVGEDRLEEGADDSHASFGDVYASFRGSEIIEGANLLMGLFRGFQ